MIHVCDCASIRKVAHNSNHYDNSDSVLAAIAKKLQESLANAKVSARQQCVYEGL